AGSGRALAAGLRAPPPVPPHRHHQPRPRLLASPLALGSGPPVAGAPGLGGDAPGGGAGHAPVTAHRPQAAGEHDHKARHCDQDDIDHDAGEQQPDADHEPEHGRDDPALVVHPRIGRVYGVSKPRVADAERLLDLLELTLLMLRERHGALPCNQTDAFAGIPARPPGLMTTVRERACGGAWRRDPRRVALPRGVTSGNAAQLDVTKAPAWCDDERGPEAFRTPAAGQAPSPGPVNRRVISAGGGGAGGFGFRAP